MHGRSVAAMSWRSCGNRSRRASYEDNLPHVVDLAMLAATAAQVLTSQGSREAR
jgi:hypothetical protein